MSVAYTLGVSPAGYVAERSYVVLAVISSIGYLMVGLLYAIALRGPLPLEKTAAGVLRNTVSAFRDRTFLLVALMACVFPLSMGMVVTVSPLYGADLGLGEGYIGLVLGGNSLIVAALALPAAARQAAVARLAPAGRRGAYQGGWALIASFSMGSALVLSGWLQARIGWQGAWLAYAAVVLAAAAALFAARRAFLRP